MKDIFTKRSINTFFEILSEFVDSLQSTCPDSAGIKTWIAWYSRVTEENRFELIQEWCNALEQPLKKGCAKYSKAVASINSSPACVYHSICYKDTEALVKSSEYFSTLDPVTTVGGMTVSDVSLFWQYFDELNKHAYSAMKKTLPSVPTTSEISADIARRKNASEPVLKHGVKDLWLKLCDTRGVECGDTDVGSKLAEFSQRTLDSQNAAEACRAQKPLAYEALIKLFPYLNTGVAFSGDEWGLVDRAMSLTTMEQNIPRPMMRGIEEVAQELVADIGSGRTDLSSLNVEAIGQRVLANVSPEEMSRFAINLDKILPAMQHM